MRQARTSVPAPRRVKISSSMPCGTRPSRITAASTPAATAPTQVSTTPRALSASELLEAVTPRRPEIDAPAAGTAASHRATGDGPAPGERHAG